MRLESGPERMSRACLPDAPGQGIPLGRGDIYLKARWAIFTHRDRQTSTQTDTVSLAVIFLKCYKVAYDFANTKTDLCQNRSRLTACMYANLGLMELTGWGLPVRSWVDAELSAIGLQSIGVGVRAVGHDVLIVGKCCGVCVCVCVCAWRELWPLFACC